MPRRYRVIRVPRRAPGLSGLGATVLSPAQIYQVALGAGFPPDAAVKMVAVAMKESGGNPQALNAVPPDNSYGLWQINMIDKPGYLLGAERRAQLGIASNDALFDPATNARAAAMLWAGNDSNIAKNWYINDGGVNQSRYQSYLPAAQSAASAVDAALDAVGPDATVIASSDPFGFLAGVDPVLVGLGVGLAALTLVAIL